MANTDCWYFAYRVDGDTVYVEDACHAQNMQIGTSPSTNYSANTGSRSSFTLPPNARILNGTYYGGLNVAYCNHLYAILKADGEPFVKRWFEKMPRIFKQPYGKYNIIAYVSYSNSSYALSIDGNMYDMNRLWNDLYTEAFTLVVDKIINEALRSYKHSRLFETKDNVIRMNESQLRGLVQIIIQKLIA